MSNDDLLKAPANVNVKIVKRAVGIHYICMYLLLEHYRAI